MTNNWFTGFLYPKGPVVVALACVILSGLTGCGSTPKGTIGGADLVTESDEPDTRTRARRHLTLAVLYFNDGKTTVALDALKQSIAADPTWFEAYNLRGLIYMRLNDIPLAEESFKRALNLNPKAAAVQHNYARMLCKQSRMQESLALFGSALANPGYGDRAKTWMAQGECQMEAGQRLEAEASFLRSYELDAANPFTGYNLALLLYQRGEFLRSQFYTRRLNNSESANAESLWLGIKVERNLANVDAASQLASQLKKRFPQARETSAYERGAFDE
ncbi:MAG: type pilus biosis/stability protein PilW [Pseudomonadota bacterium]